jgi:elongation factor G
MAVTNPELVRNVTLVGHGGTGKTTMTEAFAHAAGLTSRIGTVEEGTTITDFEDEEKQRGHSIEAAAIFFTQDGVEINVTDTPGYPDFIGPALASLGAVETAVVVVSASGGLEVNTRRLFDAAGKEGLARALVINKIGADNVNLPALLTTIRESFGNLCVPLTLPINGGKDVVNVLGEGAAGATDLGDVADARMALTEVVVEADEAMLERYLGGEKLATSELVGALAKAMAMGKVIPILFTDARTMVGVKTLMTAIAKYFPSPVVGKQRTSLWGSGDDAKEVPLPPKPDGPLWAQVFKVTADPFVGKLCLFRMLSGTLKADTQFGVDGGRKSQRAGHLYKPFGKENKDVPVLVAGDIGAVAKVDDLKYGSMMHDPSADPVTVKTPAMPTPMYSLAMTPKTRGDETKISEALSKIVQEDQTLRAEHDRETNELVIRGLGDLHVRVVLAKMKRRFNLEVETKPPRIPYRETITAKAEGHHRHKKQTGGSGQFGEVYLRVEPRESGAGFEFVDEIFGGSIPSQYLPAVEKGVKDALTGGVLAGYPLQDLLVAVTDGKHHPVDSKEIAFRTAGRNAMKDAVLKAKPVILEPIVNLEVVVPSEKMGDITGDLNGRRGRIIGMDTLPGNLSVIRAQVPLSEVMQYNSQLRSVTGGQGSYTMEPSHYEAVPGNVQQQIIAAHKPKEEVEEE